jgi:hypothetical protein
MAESVSLTTPHRSNRRRAGTVERGPFPPVGLYSDAVTSTDAVPPTDPEPPRVAPAGGAARAAEPRRLSAAGRWTRIILALAVLATTIVGAVAGQDSDFPFGPFRMYSTRDDPNGTVASTWVDGVMADGRHVVVTGSTSGVRRAEIEGQLDRFVQDPQLLSALAGAYERRHPGQRLVSLTIVTREYALVDGRATGGYTDTVRASWTQP